MNDKLLHAFLNVDQPRIGSQSPRNEHWNTLFQYYNLNSGERALHMSCGSCFIKVWIYCRHVLRLIAAAKIKPTEQQEQELKSKEFEAHNKL